MSLVLIYTTNHCGPCRRLKNDGFYNKLYNILDGNNIPYKHLNFEGWNDFGRTGDVRDEFHRETGMFVPKYVIVPQHQYENVNIDNQTLLTSTKVLNYSIVDKYFVEYDKRYNLDDIVQFIVENAGYFPETKEPCDI